MALNGLNRITLLRKLIAQLAYGSLKILSFLVIVKHLSFVRFSSGPACMIADCPNSLSVELGSPISFSLPHPMPPDHKPSSHSNYLKSTQPSSPNPITLSIFGRIHSKTNIVVIRRTVSRKVGDETIVG